ncbi:hypothetical protein ADK70_29830 [Streptomyces rimosus subsp. pseudoverticillatus]|uniref:DUF1996 domain-containing protein n=1 Tax=Streptomyces rimosus TaxID=1927 RepID=UPI0006B261F8|nr:DUF1996 domain-containing protein [Streptomyces rimosus]KOT79743.1 hypothetical protein ADK70_29830 [Streptomyces rimosus subsp. pseudoverticillatus]
MKRQKRITARPHKRTRLSKRSGALILTALAACGGTAIIAAQALAGPGGPGAGGTDASAGGGAGTVAGRTISCPDVGQRLRSLPPAGAPEVNRDLGQLDAQVAQAFRRWSADPGTQDQVLRGLEKDRKATIGRITDALRRAGERPDALDRLSACRTTTGSATTARNAPRDARGGNSAGNGPFRDDFVDIKTVRPNTRGNGQGGRGTASGSFRSECGRNENRHNNPDNLIVAPGVSNGAHHMHDYVGNLATNAFSSDRELAGAGTTCGNGDRSTYYWPVLRLRDNGRERDADAPGGGQDGNVGTILRPAAVSLKFDGNGADKVTAMPPFLRNLTGDAKALTNGPANANASWSCTGFENRQLKNKYPICPRGSNVVRSLAFPNCWDGRNIDSANHRTHVVFPDGNGRCRNGFRAIPRLVQRLTYAVPPNAQYAVDSFPDQLHNPVTDHGDFINVMPQRLMRTAVDCINSGRDCR